ncbi:MAG: DUF4381 domain-containing protein [Deltaproteobacteria bacterium]|nr:DUF4381 domain-containing protein [Deltaproteobacteria bacterium]
MRCLVLLFVVACGGKSLLDQQQVTAAEPTKDAVTKTTENGPVKATVTVWPPKPSLGDPIYLRLDVDAAAGVSIDAPFQEAGDQRMGRFQVTGFQRDTQHKSDGGVHERQTYTLEAPASGKQRIPHLRLEMVDTRPGQGSEVGKTQEILTDEVPLDIAPVKAEAIAAELKPAPGKLDENVGGPPWTWILLGGSLIMMLGAGGVLAWRVLGTKRRIAEQRSAYEDAIAALASLQKRGAPSAEDADRWFVELSAIVRRYLEHRYDIRAPELTTEEFLQEAARARELTQEHRAQLTAFLERCDRVKFAGYRPDEAESLATLQAARTFVEDTKAPEQPPAKEAA